MSDDEVRVQIQPLSGYPEWLPGGRLAEDRLLRRIRDQFELYGFAPIETPAVERWEVLTAKGGVDRQIYGVQNARSGDEQPTMGLHFDLTVPLARYVVQHAEELTFPFRRYQIQKVWRGEHAQRGRFREFYQCDIDIVGRNSLDPVFDAEIPCVIGAAFDALLAEVDNPPAYTVHVSNRKVLQSLLAAMGCGEKTTDVMRLVDKVGKDSEALKRGLFELGLEAKHAAVVSQVVTSADLAQCRVLLEAVGADCGGLDELEALLHNAVHLGLPADRLAVDLSIARGLDYYTGTVYETFLTGREDWGSVCSGGRYDDLAGLFTKMNYPGVGISIGLTRLFDLLVKEEYLKVETQSPTQVLVTTVQRQQFWDDYLALAATLRRAGVRAEVYLEKERLRGQLGYAADKGIPLAIIAGSDEFEAGQVTIKDLRAGTQEVVAADAMVAYIERLLA